MQGRECLRELLLGEQGCFAGGTLFDTTQCFLKARGFDGFGEVVDGFDGKGFDREFMVRCDEYGWRHMGEADCVDDVETAAAGHLDVEEEKVCGCGLQAGDGFFAVSAFSDDVDVGVVRQEEFEALTCKRLIVGDDGFEGHAR